MNNNVLNAADQMILHLWLPKPSHGLKSVGPWQSQYTNKHVHWSKLDNTVIKELIVINSLKRFNQETDIQGLWDINKYVT